jgi:hypothetical protein
MMEREKQTDGKTKRWRNTEMARHIEGETDRQKYRDIKKER